MEKQPFRESSPESELTDAELLQQIRDDSLYLHDNGIVRRLMHKMNEGRGIYDSPINIDSLYVQIAREKVSRDRMVTVVNIFQFNTNQGYIVQTALLGENNILGLIQLSPEEANNIRTIAASRPIQRGNARHIALLNARG